MEEGIIKIAKAENLNETPLRLKERMAFQVFLMQSMLGDKLTQETEKEWEDRKLQWADAYAKTVSDIIDNTENKEIIDLIKEEKYKEASTIISEMLKVKKAA